ncbi:hypothetical protein EVJ58_g6986 [Rhodofomes roseus]|uniref:Uncharacterized protein n=1 Tax=Rhodofomes roseus TaxID=34475 RepID=A0A4Y9Y4W1_9APHY|nr:hypothetical protein EVJ58_g6986 [Rhodofomes roseus]
MARKKMKSESGPFHPTNICKPGALPSMFIFHGITFSCLFSLEQPALFPNHTNFQHTVDMCGHANEPYYICNPAEYGSYSQDCKTENAAIYFDQEAFHAKQLLCKQPVKYTTALKDLQLWGGKPKKQLPGIGAHSSTMLASEFVYQGIVAHPTAEEMGSTVWHIKSGALGGLTYLQILPLGKVTKAATMATFKSAYEHLDNTLPNTTKQSIGFDEIMVEHLLCKVARWLHFCKD